MSSTPCLGRRSPIAKEIKDYIILIGCYRMGLFVIEKADCDPADLNALLSALHEKAPAFGGAK